MVGVGVVVGVGVEVGVGVVVDVVVVVGVGVVGGVGVGVAMKYIGVFRWTGGTYRDHDFKDLDLIGAEEWIDVEADTPAQAAKKVWASWRASSFPAKHMARYQGLRKDAQE